MPCYTADRDAVAMLEAEPLAQGLHEQYAVALAGVVGYDRTPAGAFRLLGATCRERCEAALAVIREGASDGD